MKFEVITSQVLILFLIMFVGLAARKFRLLNNELNTGLTNFILNVTFPLNIIASFSFSFSRTILRNILIIFSCAALAHLLAAVISVFLYLRFPGPQRRILSFITIFGNVGFMGLPILESLFGKAGVFYGSIYVVVFNIFVWTLGVMIFTGKEDLKILKALASPALIAVLTGSALSILTIKLPLPVLKTLETVGSMTTPLSMIVVGSMMADIKIKELFSGFPVYYGTLARLLIIPLVLAFVLKFFNVPEQLLRISMTSTAMPAASLTAILAGKYKGDTVLASRIIILSTAFSIITIPLILIWV